jgi:Lar family restriction alleviation protein
VVDDIKLALLGNKEAAKRLTEAGVLVPCPFCGGEAEVVAYGPRLLRPSRNHVYSVSCNECEMMFGWDVDYGGRYDTEYEVMLAWNTRAPILSAKEMKELSHG